MSEAQEPTPFSMKRPVAVAVIVLLIGAFVTTTLFYQIRQRERARLVQAQLRAEEVLDAVETRFLDLETLTAGQQQALRTYLNPIHLEHAQQYGIDRLESRAQADSLVRAGELVRLEPEPYFDIAPMDYSVPVVVAPAANLLHEIGLRFHDALQTRGLPPYRFVITSGTRTIEDQAALQRVNPNAATESAHEYGTTVDLRYTGFDLDPALVLEAFPVPDSLDLNEEVLAKRLAAGFQRFAEKYESRLKGLLGRVLIDLQAEGKVVAVHERLQPVYHITVAAPVQPPAEGVTEADGGNATNALGLPATPQAW